MRLVSASLVSLRCTAINNLAVVRTYRENLRQQKLEGELLEVHQDTNHICCLQLQLLTLSISS